MAIQVKLKCSECAIVREADLKPDDKEIICPVCGRRMANLTPDEHREIGQVQSKQRMYCIISIVLFAIAIACLVLWVGTDPAKWVSGKESQEANMAMLLGALACALGAVIIGAIGSAKRYVVEF